MNYCRNVFFVGRLEEQWNEQQIFNGLISIVLYGFLKVDFSYYNSDIVFFHDPDNRDYIDYYRIPESRWNKECCFCKSKEGCCMSCSGNKCDKTFHVSCGIQHNVFFFIKIFSLGSFRISCIKISRSTRSHLWLLWDTYKII